MRLLRLSGERTLSQVMDKAYGIKAARTAEAKRAEAALAEMNPHLRDLKDLPDGTVVLVPDVPELKSTEHVAPAMEIVADLMDDLEQAVEDAHKAIVARSAENIREDRDLLDRLKSSSAVEEVKKSPELKNWIAAATAHTEERVTKIEAAASAQKEALKEVSTDLRAFVKEWRRQT